MLPVVRVAARSGDLLVPTASAAETEEAPEAETKPEAAPPRPAPAPAQRPAPPRPARGGMVSLNFNRADLVEVIHVLAQHLRINYTIDPEVKGTVTIYSAEPLRQEDLLPIFHQILRINGAVAVKTGNLYRIAPIKEGKGLARPMAGREDSFALQVVPVRFFSVTEMKRLLTPFVTPGGEILDFPRGNFLIIVDLPSNIQRLMEIKDLIDVNVFAGTRMELYQPKVASAEELANEMTKIMQAYASSATQAEGFAAQFIAIPRINQLLVISHSEAAWAYAKRWLERIDTVGEGPGRRIFIYPVENGKASELADTLNQALGITGVARREAPRTLQDLHRATPPGPAAPGTRPGLPPLYGPAAPSLTPPVAGAMAAVPVPTPMPPTPPPPTAPAPPPVPPPGVARAPQPPSPRAEDQLRIVPDPATNSLIIYGTAQEFQNIKNILKELDAIPRQVLLDVLIAEVTLTDDQSFGIEYEILRGTRSIFGQAFGSRGAIRSGILPAPPTGGGTTQFGQGISGIIGSNDLKVFINALLSDSRVKVLSSPTILATDNRPARIQVGTEEPIPTGTIVAAVGQVSSSTTIQYRNTGRIVTIIPQVNSLGLVHLQIKAEASQRGSNVVLGQDSFPSFETRDAETTAVVQDGETLAIGGIIADRKSRSRRGIPFLMDIPVIGRFFGATFDEVDRTELLMLITPRVIRNVAEARDATREFKERLSTVARELEREKLRKADQPLRAPVEPPKSAPPEERTKSQPEGRSESRLPPAKSIAWEAPLEKPDEPEDAAGPDRGAQAAAQSVPIVLTQSRAVNGRNGGAARRWSIQVGSFPVEKLAREMAEKLRDRGYSTYMVETNINGRQWYRVRVGPLGSYREASALLETLRKKEGVADAFMASP